MEQDCLLICDPGYERLLRAPCSFARPWPTDVLSYLTTSKLSVLEEIKQTGGLSLETRNNLEAYALYRCLQSDAR